MLGYGKEVLACYATRVVLADIRAPTLIGYPTVMKTTRTALSRGKWFSLKFVFANANSHL